MRLPLVNQAGNFAFLERRPPDVVDTDEPEPVSIHSSIAQKADSHFLQARSTCRRPPPATNVGRSHDFP